MDRTQAANNVDIGGGKRGFRNRNTPSGLRGTAHDAADRNAVQEELLGVIEGYGLSPASNNWAQVLQALRRAAGGNVTSVTSSPTLTADNAGLVLIDASAASRIVTLPAANGAGGAPIPFCFKRVDTNFSSTNTVTIQRAGTDDIEGVNSITLLPTESLSLVSDGASGWVITGGRGGRVLGANGWRRNVGGELEVWGTQAFTDLATNANVACTFLRQFPVACDNLQVSIGLSGGFVTYGVYKSDSRTTSGFTAVITEAAAVTQTGGEVSFRAIGR